MKKLVVVTGAAGKTGQAVVAALSRRGIPVRAWVHRAEQAEAGVPGATETVAVDLADGDDVAANLRGAGAIYLIAPNMHPDELGLLRGVIDSCRRHGPQRVVYHSVIHPYAPKMPHHVAKAEVEAYLAESGLEWTALQPASYFENVYGVWESVLERGIWPLPYAADKPFTPVALTDVAEVAATALTTRRHRYGTFELAGPEVLTTAQMAEIAGDVLGRDITVTVNREPDPSRDPRLQAMFDYYDRWGICGNSTVLAGLLDRPPTSWHTWVSQHR